MFCVIALLCVALHGFVLLFFVLFCFVLLCVLVTVVAADACVLCFGLISVFFFYLLCLNLFLFCFDLL